MPLATGDRLLVAYTDEPELYHERVVLAHLRGARYLIVTPDEDVYEESYEVSNEDIEAVRILPREGLPEGVVAADCYRFEEALSEDRVLRLREEGLRVLSLRGPDGIGLVDETAPRAFVGAAGALGQWRCGENTTGGRTRGEPVPLRVCPGTFRNNGKMVVRWDSEDVFIVWLSSDSLENRLKQQSPVDARVLHVRLRNGKRDREWSDAVHDGDETAYADWPLKRPRTTAWCMEFVSQQGTGIGNHHQVWRRSAGLGIQGYGVPEHELILEVCRLAVQYDQLNVKNSSAFDSLLRRAQTIEYAHADAVRDSLSGSTGNAKVNKGSGALTMEEADAFSGLAKGHGIMVCPRLLEFVKDDVKNQSELMKVMVKAREFRANLAKM
eukprot:TRINITY_DN90771_c0_g1_i1.p1 TRINITY_DN90771_c0_g1~~TRINITY_DN90771_c0_g1_i1.p1  ORF type:complete len:382 (+),score=41.44 TRINITY_DN90771_c0_g1_i1:318-1463(+)